MIILTSMVGDLFHIGHLNIIQEGSKLGTLIVCVPTSDGALKAKGKAPVMTMEERLRVVQGIKGVHFALGFEGNEELDKIIELIKPDLFVRGDDWPDFPGKEKLKKLKIPVKYIPYTSGISSTIIKERICLQALEQSKKR